jgi:hypothetical protein
VINAQTVQPEPFLFARRLLSGLREVAGLSESAACSQQTHLTPLHEV